MQRFRFSTKSKIQLNISRVKHHHSPIHNPILITSRGFQPSNDLYENIHLLFPYQNRCPTIGGMNVRLGRQLNISYLADAKS